MGTWSAGNFDSDAAQDVLAEVTGPVDAEIEGFMNSDTVAPEQRAMLVAMIRGANPRFLRWGGSALVRWGGAAELKVPIHQIHGEDDRILPWGLSAADVTVPGAGHLMNITHPEEVNRFIAERVS